MKKLMKRTMTCALTATLALSAVACGGGGNEENNEAIDSSRTQLYVFNFDGGFGSAWLADAKTRYEALHAEDVYETGKKGVQIVINNTKTGREGAAILHNVDEVYFTESVQYYQTINDKAFLDITDAITGENPYEKDKTIESKLTEEQKGFYGYVSGDKTIYYGIPHYSGSFGFAYDIDLFEEKGYYLKDGYSYQTSADLQDCFIYMPTDKKTAGPDNEYGTYDDGLPTTYQEFYMLCDYIAGGGDTPICWSGEHYATYMQLLYNQVAVNDLGLDQARLSYTMNGEATTLGTVNASGEFVKDAQATTITPDNAYELYRQQEKYDALEFLKTLLTTDRYHNKSAFDSTHSHLAAQQDFLWSGKDGATKPIAMLADGVWWQSEAEETFKAMESQNKDWSKMKRNIGWLPLPRSEGKEGNKNVYFDHLYSMSFVKANIAEYKKDLAIDFLQFVHTDESMVKFSQITNTPKAFNYEMKSEDLQGMTSFGRSLMEFKQKSDVLYPVSNEAKFINNQSTFSAGNAYQALVYDFVQGRPTTAFHTTPSLTAATYFAGMYQYYKTEWTKLK